ncbi:GSCOCG00001629001-RA-CDS, partial [Cotesia congregata]
VSDPCLDKYCGAGRKCRLSPDGGVALCVCIKKCGIRHRPVCGSDGKVYANHCELHRAACNKGTPLTVSRLMRCLHQEHVGAFLFFSFFFIFLLAHFYSRAPFPEKFTHIQST